MEIKEKEIWKIIEEYPEYQVSSFGRVKSLKFDKEKILKQSISKNGYCNVLLCKDGKIKTCKVHRLVAIAFIPNPDNYLCVNHKDENPSNNCISNLEWCSYQYNNSYGTKPERISKALKGRVFSQETKDKLSKALKGKPNLVLSKPILQLSKSGNIIIKKWESAGQASKELNINRSCINSCCNGKRKLTGKYKWMYYEDYINKMNNYFDMALKEVS